MRADIQRKCLWSPLKKQQWVSELCLNAPTIRSWEPAAPALPHYTQRKQEEQLQAATVLTYWDRDNQWLKERENQRKKTAMHLSSNCLFSQGHNPMIDCTLDRLTLSLPLVPDRSPSESQCFLAHWKSYDWTYDLWEQWWKNTKGLVPRSNTWLVLWTTTISNPFCVRISEGE